MGNRAQCDEVAQAYKTLLKARERAWKVYCKALVKAEKT